MKIEIKSVPHRKIAIKDIVQNPHRDFAANPISPEKVENLIDSISRTGFWDNVVVREHPTKDGKYQLAYGHNRLAALKDKKIIVDTITIPVAKLTDWEMYCAMVDENETQGTMTPAIAFENIDVGCDLIEAALKKIGPQGTWEEFTETLGCSGTENKGNRFAQARNDYFAGQGLGRGFLKDFLPCGEMRSNTISEVTQSRYGSLREKAKQKEAEAKRKAAEAEADAKKAEQLKAEADKLEADAKRIGKGSIKKEVLLKFATPNMMTDFGAAVRQLAIPPKLHAAAADHVLRMGVYQQGIKRELQNWFVNVTSVGAPQAAKAKAVPDVNEFAKQTLVELSAGYFPEPRVAQLDAIIKHRDHVQPRLLRDLAKTLRDIARTADAFADAIEGNAPAAKASPRLLALSK